MAKKQEAETAIAEVNPAELTTTTASGLVIEQSDIMVPRVNVIQKTSEIEAPLGAVVLDKQYVLAPVDESIPVVVLAAVKGWRENIDYDSDEVPQVAYSQEERQRIAATSEYDMLEFADITMLFKQPEGDDNEAAYPFPIGEDNYALGKINVAKDAYRQTFKTLATFAQFNPAAKMQHRVWDFKSSLISKGKYSWFAPSLKVSKVQPSDAVITFVDTFAG